MSQVPNPYSSSNYSPAPAPVDDGSLTAVDWVLCVLCSGIGCIVGIVRMIQGKKNGAKMFGISLGFVILWNIVRVAIQLAANQP